ncbi:MFS transporter [Streptomyces sp. NPDC047108]|uniref:MFS transporter n=1 Tax=Streptomyces sp. NPDC047108 TaxID=3155025 RepID=UPI0033FBA394
MTAPGSSTSRRAPHRTAATWTAYVLLGHYAFVVSAIGPAVAFLRDERALSYTAGGLHFSALAAGVVIAGAFGDALVHRHGRRALLTAGLLGFTAAQGAFVLGPTLGATVASAALMGLFGGLVLSGSTAVLTTEHPRHRAAALAEANTAASAMAVAAPLLLGAGAATTFGWRPGVVATTPIALACAVLVRKLPDRGEDAAGPVRRRPGGRRRAEPLPPRFWTLWFLLFLVDAVEFSVAFWSASYLEDAVGLARPVAASAAGAFLVGMLAGRAAGSLLARGAGRERTLLTGALALAGLGFLIYRLGPGWVTGGGGASAATGTTAVVGLLLLGLGVANLWPLSLSLALEASGGRPDAAAARSSLAAGVAILVAPFLLGRLADHFGLAPAHWIVPVLLGAAGVVLWWGTDRGPRNGRPVRTDRGVRGRRLVG